MKITLYFIKKGSPDDILEVTQSEWTDSNLFTVTMEEPLKTRISKTFTILNAQGVLEYISNLFNLLQ